MIVLKGPWEAWAVPEGPKSVTIGVLDGVHVGHRSLLAKLRQSMVPTVLTFDPHPIEVLRPGSHPRLITCLDERVALLAEAGVECVGVLDLAAIKDLAPDVFVSDILVGALGIAHIVVGEDFQYGKDRGGDVELLTDMGAAFGFEVEAIPLVAGAGSVVSSSRIRALLEEGDVAGAAALLGSRFSLTGVVVDGDKRGREIGFPTANMRPPAQKVIPGSGVYACMVSFEDGIKRPAAVNVGVRPTFGGGELLVEAYVLDFDEDVYGRSMTVWFVDRLRPELAFDDVEALVAAMRDDVARARRILTGPGEANVS